MGRYLIMKDSERALEPKEFDWDIPSCYSQGHMFFISSAFPWQEVNSGQQEHLKQHYCKWAFCKMWRNYTVIQTNSVFLLYTILSHAMYVTTTNKTWWHHNKNVVLKSTCMRRPFFAAQHKSCTQL